MSVGIFGYQGPPDSSAMIVANYDRGWVVAVSLPDLRRGLEVKAICDLCGQPVDTGISITWSDLPLRRGGRWSHHCGGSARLPDQYVVTDRSTGEQLDLFRPPRQQVTASAITLAELLRLSQAARAVQDGRAGAIERLDQVLAEAPEPIRRLGERWTREQKLTLAGVIIALVALVIPFMKSDGGVTEQQLERLIEQLIEQQSDGPGEQGQPEDGATGGASQAGAGERSAPMGAAGADGDGRPAKAKHREGVDSPHE